MKLFALTTDKDECEEDNPCEQECRNTFGSYVCSCRNGFLESNDSSSCIGKFIILADQSWKTKRYFKSSTIYNITAYALWKFFNQNLLSILVVVYTTMIALLNIDYLFT